MKDIDNIEDWYREELDNYSVEPNKDIWQSLSADLDADAPLTDENISEWYKKEVAKLEERPDYSVWEKLSVKLDTSSVWDKLVVSLNRYDQLIWWRNLAFKGTAVFLLLFGSYWAYTNYQYTNDNNSVSKTANTIKSVTSDKVVTKNSIVSKNNKGGTPLTNTMINNDSYSEKNTTDNKLSSKNDLSSNNAIKEAIVKTKAQAVNQSTSNYSNNLRAAVTNESYFNQISVNNLSSLKTENERTIFTDFDRHHLIEQDFSRFFENGGFLVKKDKNKIVFNSKRFSSYFIYGLYARRFYVGINAGIKKQGIINDMKKNSELANYNQTDFLDFGNNFGATVGYIVSDNFNLETNINFISTSGYKRAFNGEGISYKENLNLNYSSLSILAKKMNNKSTFDNKVYSTNFIAGVYAGYLQSATSEVNNNSQKTNKYNKSDFGLVLGVEQDRYITKTLVITPGVRYNQGLLNIANDNSSFNSARNFSFEFNLGVKYIFLKKGN